MLHIIRLPRFHIIFLVICRIGLIEELMMKYRFVFALLLAGMSLIACSGDKASTKEFFVETVDGVEIIHNTATPAFPGIRQR